MNETRFPLCWPSNWKRTPNRAGAQFGRVRKNYQAGVASYGGKERVSISGALDRISTELERFGVKPETVIVSTNLPTNIQGAPRGDRGEPRDPGVAVYWKNKSGKPECMAIDRYTRVADNLAAVAATLEALRAIERHGGASILDRAFAGFAQLPAAIITQRPWRDVFGVGPNDHLNADAIDTRFKALAHKVHPDRGGNHEAMTELNAARDAALQEIGGR